MCPRACSDPGGLTGYTCVSAATQLGECWDGCVSDGRHPALRIRAARFSKGVASQKGCLVLGVS
eukprot:8974726-Alexandrium_andersonii.AAC.1